MRISKIFTIIISLIFVLATATSVLAVVEDDFNRVDSATLGTATNGNAWTENADASIVNNQAKIVGATTFTHVLALDNTNSPRYDFQWNVSSITTQHVMKLGSSSTGADSEAAIKWNIFNGYLQWTNGAAWQNTGFVPTINELHNYSIRNINYVADTYDIYVDDVLVDSATFLYNKDIIYFGINSYVSTINVIDCVTSNGTECVPPVPPVTLSNFSTVSTANYNFDTPVTISTAYGVVNSLTYNNTVSASEPFYFASSLTVYNGPSTANCRITIDGVSVASTSRTLTANTYGNIALVSPADNLSLGEHIINTECRKVGGSNYVVENSQLSQFLLYDTNSNSTITRLAFEDAGPILIDSQFEIADSYSDSNIDSDIAQLRSGLLQFGQSFTGDDELIYDTSFYLKKIGNPAGSIKAELYAFDESGPDVLTPVLVSSNSIDISAISSSYEKTTFTFDNSYLINSTTLSYFVSLKLTDISSDTSNYVAIGLDDSTPTHNGEAYYNNTGTGGFTSLGSPTNNRDFAFEVRTTDPNLGSFSFTTSDTTNTTNSNFLVTQGVVNYNYVVEDNITTYFKIEETGEVCGPYTRGGSAGSVGSIGASCLFTNLSSSTTYNLSLYGYTELGTGSLTNLASNLYEVQLNTSAANITTLNKVVPASTLTLVDSVNINNILGGDFNVFSQASIMVNSNVSQDAYFYLSNSVNTSSFYRTLSSDGKNGNVVIQNVFSESGIVDTPVSLYAYCPSGCTISSGSLNAFITDASTVSTGLFNITAYNVYNNTVIQSFNVTIGGSTQSTSNGYVEFIGQGNINVIVEAENFFSNTTIHDTTTNLNASLVKYVEIRVNNIGGSGVTNFTVNTSSATYTTNNGVAYLPVSLANTSVTANSLTFAGQTDLVNQTQYYNFSVYAERSIRINIYNGTSDSLLAQTVSVNTVSNVSSFTNTTVDGTLYLTLLNPISYELRFTSAGFNSQSIFLSVTEDSTQEVNIYMVSNASSVLQRVQVASLEGADIEGAIVRLQVQASDQDSLFFNVDEKSTNSEGKTAFYVTKGIDTFYRFIVVYDGEVKLTTVETFFLPTIDEIITLEIDTSSVSGVSIDGLGLSTSLVASGVSNETYTYSWVDANNEVVGGRLEVYLQNLNYTGFAAEELNNSGVVSGFSGTLTASLPVVNNTVFFVKAYAVYDSYEVLVEERTVIFGETISLERNSSLLLAAIVFLIVVLLTVSFGPLFSGLIGFIVLLGLSLVGLVTIPIAIITSFMAFLFIVFIKVKGGSNA